MVKEATALGLRYIFADSPKKWNHNDINSLNQALEKRMSKEKKVASVKGKGNKKKAESVSNK